MKASTLRGEWEAVTKSLRVVSLGMIIALVVCLGGAIMAGLGIASVGPLRSTTLVLVPLFIALLLAGVYAGATSERLRREG